MKYKAIVEYEYPIEHKPPVKADIYLHGDKVTTSEIKPLQTELPYNATNGDMIKALFPNFYYAEGRTKVYYSDYPNVSMQFKAEWWNAPYKENRQ